MQFDFWMLTPFFILTLMKISSINADSSKNQRKSNDQGDNYIITHYGREYYTPATDSDTQPHKSGYFTAEVTPVDVNTGEELRPVKDIFVPMHTGYSITSNSADQQHQQPQNHKKIETNIKPSVSSPQWNKESTAAETSAKENIDSSKSKIPKKFKTKVNFGVKKKNPAEFNESAAPVRATESVQNVKNIPKRHVGDIPREFLPSHLFNRRFEVPDRRWNHVNYFY